MALSVNEIKHGNIINTPYGEHKVYGSSPDVVQIDIDGTIYDFDLDETQPIKLTEEWLLRFGFRQLDKYTFCKNGFFIHKRKIGFIFNVGKKKVNLPFIHTAQNLYFALTSKELELKDK